MYNKVTKVAAVVCLALGMSPAVAQDDNVMIINGDVEMITKAAAGADSPLSELFSGWHFRTIETQALQLDDFDNPSFIFVEEGEDIYNTADGSEGKSCADCHADVAEFAGLRTVLPRWDDEAGGIQSMEDYVNECRTDRMGAEAWKWSARQMTSVTALISLQSRGMPMSVATDGSASGAFELGKEIYYTRVGQLDMACSNCHEDNYGVMIRADHLSQGHTNGFPTYRLKNAKLNSMHARFKGCMKNIRATPYAEGSEEFRALELYVSSRGNGLAVESPSVRN